MDRGAWQAIVQGVAKTQTRLKRLGTHVQQTGMSIPLRSLFGLEVPTLGASGAVTCRFQLLVFCPSFLLHFLLSFPFLPFFSSFLPFSYSAIMWMQLEKSVWKSSLGCFNMGYLYAQFQAASQIYSTNLLFKKSMSGVHLFRFFLFSSAKPCTLTRSHVMRTL